MGVDPLGKPVILLCIPSALELGAVLALAIQLKVIVVLESGEFRRLIASSARIAGMNRTPSVLARTRSPGNTTARPMRIGALIEVNSICAHAEGS